MRISWGWVWGDEDQLGNLNELSPELTKMALSKVVHTLCRLLVTVCSDKSQFVVIRITHLKEATSSNDCYSGDVG